MTRGRKRKAGSRYPSGDRKRSETEREAMSTAIEARRKHFGVPTKVARDERLGSALGRLAFKSLISEVQYQAGREFGILHLHHAIVMGLPVPNPHSVSGALVKEGIFGSQTDVNADDIVKKIRKRFDEATKAIEECDREQRLSTGRRPSWLIYHLICRDEDITNAKVDDLGNLRVALNALARNFRLGVAKQYAA